jgi:uncharacterized repeat protein (TIGR02543 family)
LTLIFTAIIVVLAGAISAAAETYTESLILQTDGLHYGSDPTPLEASDSKLGGGSYTYNNDTKTLTLNGVNFTTSARFALDLRDYSSPLTLNINGTNSFESTHNNSGSAVGIITHQRLTITGSGTVYATASGDAYMEARTGISAEMSTGEIIINSGTVIARGTTYGIYTSKITVNGGSLIATGIGIDSSGIQTIDADFSVADLVINGGTVQATGVCGINGLNIAINGGTVTATGMNNADGDSYGISGLNVTIGGTAEVTATGGNSTNGNSYGIELAESAVYSTEDSDQPILTPITRKLEISGTARVTAEGGNAPLGNSYGIFIAAPVFNYAAEFSISGGSLTASGNTSALSQAPSTFPVAYTWSANGSDPSSSAYSYTASHKSLTIATLTAATPATYTFNKAVSSDTLFEITYSLAPGVSFNNIVKNGTTALTSTTQWVAKDNNVIEITSSYLMGLDVGTYTITLDTTADVDPTVALTVTNVYDKGLVLKSDGLYYNNFLLGNSDSKLGGGSYSYTGGTLTLNGVSFTTSADQALTTGGNISVLTLTGDNSLISTSINGIGIYEENNSLSIGGSGSLTVSGSNTGIWLDTGILTITGGTINANGGSNSLKATSGINITGGTVKATSEVDDCDPNPTNGTSDVYKTTLTGLPASTAVTAFSKTYGITGVKTDTDGKLYFYLPRAGSNEYITLTIGGVTYYGVIPVVFTETTVTMSSTFTATDFLLLTSEGNIKYAGYTIPQNTASHILGGGKYSFSSGTLTLNGVNFTTSYNDALNIINYTGDLTINLVGENILTATNGTNAVDSNGIVSYGKNVTISGSGSLITTGGTAIWYSYGIDAGVITITGGNIIATGGTAGNGSYGISATSNIITGGSLNASSLNKTPTNGTSNVYKTTLTGLPASTAVTAFSKTYGITGVKTDTSGKLYFYLPRAASNEAISLTLANGKTYYGTIPRGNAEATVTMSETLTRTESLVLTSTGKLTYGGIEIPQGAASPYLGGGQYSFSSGTLTINGVNFTTSADTALELNLYTSPITLHIVGANTFVSTFIGLGDTTGITAKDTLTITGSGSLTATGGESTSTGLSFGINTYKDINISGVTVEATGGAAGEQSYGIRASTDINISGTANVTATGGTTQETSYGIRAYNDFTVSGTAKVNATGGTGVMDSYGIMATNTLNVTGGTVVFSGETSAATTGSLTPAIAYIDENYADGRNKVRVNNTAVNLTTVKYYEAYATAADLGVTAVTITPETASIIPGAAVQFSAAVTDTSAFDDFNISWSVSGATGTTAISSTGLLTIDPAQAIGTVLTVTATCAEDTAKYDTATVSVVEETFDVTFNTNGGSVVAKQTVAKGGTATRPTAPTKEGYTFEGWYSDSTLETLFDFNTPITANCTLYAKWTANPEPEPKPEPEPEPKPQPETITHTNEILSVGDSDFSGYPPIPNSVPIINHNAPRKFVSNGVTAILMPDGTVIAALNPNGTVNGNATAAAVRAAKMLGKGAITVTIPEGAIGISKSACAKIYKAARGTPVTLVFELAPVTVYRVKLTEKTGQIVPAEDFFDFR